jgi:hypothetical protein
MPKTGTEITDADGGLKKLQNEGWHCAHGEAGKAPKGQDMWHVIPRYERPMAEIWPPKKK